jgi:hypothetical protein
VSIIPISQTKTLSVNLIFFQLRKNLALAKESDREITWKPEKKSIKPKAFELLK